MIAFTESEIEIFSLDELKDLGFSYIPGPSIAPDVEEAMQQPPLLVAEPFAPYGTLEKRASYSEVILRSILEQAHTPFKSHYSGNGKARSAESRSICVFTAAY